MNVIILAAGFFEDLKPMSLTRPGSLLPVGGKPILEWFLEYALPGETGEASTLTIVTNALYANQFQMWANRCPLFSEGNWKVQIVSNGATDISENRGAVHDLHLGIRSFHDSRDCLVLGGDNFIFKKLDGFIEWARDLRSAAIVACDVGSMDRVRDLSSVQINPAHQITSFEEKPLHPKSTVSAALIYYLPSRILPMIGQFLNQGRNPDRPGRFIEWLTSHPEPVYGWVHDGAWYDISNPQTLEEVNRILNQSSN